MNFIINLQLREGNDEARDLTMKTLIEQHCNKCINK